MAAQEDNQGAVRALQRVAGKAGPARESEGKRKGARRRQRRAALPSGYARGSGAGVVESQQPQGTAGIE